jgi:hypothetical protein
LIAASAAVAALAFAPAAAAALAPGPYSFDLPGLKGIPVEVGDCGFECIRLTTPNGFKVDMQEDRRGERYTGLARDPNGAMCQGRPVPADVFYSVYTDGSGGRVLVQGEPCGPGQPVNGLMFALAPMG